MFKKIVGGLLCGLAVLSLAGCGVKEDKATVTVKELTDKIIEAKIINSAEIVEDNLIKEMYGVDTDAVSEISIIERKMTGGIESFAAVKAKDGEMESARAEIKKINDFLVGKAWYPDEKEAVKNIVTEEYKDIVYLYLFTEEAKDDGIKLLNENLK